MIKGRFAEEFKEEAVKQVLERGRRCGQTPGHFGTTLVQVGKSIQSQRH